MYIILDASNGRTTVYGPFPSRRAAQDWALEHLGDVDSWGARRLVDPTTWRTAG